MMKSPFPIYITILLLCFGCLWSCQADRLTDDPRCVLDFSKDTVSFDTVFTTIGSSTQQLIVRNPNKNALQIEQIWLAQGKYFRVNVDGIPMEQGSGRAALDAALTLAGGDSAFVFIRATIDPMDSNSPVFIRDTLVFALKQGVVQQVILEAYGQDVIIIRSSRGRTEYPNGFTFRGEKPYLLYDSVLVADPLVMEAGATLYMHDKAALFALGNVTAEGTLDAPVTIRGDRLDRLFDSVPYRYAAGTWDGVYLLGYDEKVQYDLSYVNIEGGNIGLYCSSNRTQDLSALHLTGSRIHNHALYGVVMQNIEGHVVNTEVSNCAAYCIYIEGGEYEFVHTTVASYFGATNVNIQSQQNQNVAAVYVNNLSKTGPETLVSFKNSIITGTRKNQFVLATPLPQYYTGEFVGNYLKTDTLVIPSARGNVYWQAEDTAEVFRNTYYKYKEYKYYDFRLDSLSPARGIGDSITALPYPHDRLGVSRAGLAPDAGCYQYAE